MDTIRSLPQVWTKKSWRGGSFHPTGSSPWYTGAEGILLCLWIHFRQSGLLKRYGWVSWNIISCAFTFTCSEISMSTKRYKQKIVQNIGKQNKGVKTTCQWWHIETTGSYDDCAESALVNRLLEVFNCSVTIVFITVHSHSSCWTWWF